ncbi:SRPBCC domain-containing protein [Paenibacillus hexagrammi]|uniref:SRPBCC domain-containing protein n=1 Tax=Paenibacillus hexagrammi TaxID=2908839 RepID=A0ABY3SH30_9BACL|nr:SRPBCC domain-containing protein [Paenibacillus sp. YPD9-1]UJF32499.1 SRPBCC domain-containing protein [Paenibacillus sp. YPD9-1]
MSNQLVIQTEGQYLIMERIFNAPRELVFKAHTEAEHLKKWWGPRGWEVTHCTVDLRPGGAWHYCMKCVDEKQGDFFGFESWGKAIYKEIEAPATFSYTDYFSDAEGNESQGMPSSDITVTFEEFEGTTKYVSRARYESAEALKQVIEMGMEQGITETMDRFAEYLETIR